MSWAGLSGGTVELRPSTVESDRFGLSVARVVVGFDAAADNVSSAGRVPDVASRLTAVLRAASEDLLIVRWPAQHVQLGAAAAASGRAIIPADMLTYWEVPADRLASNTAPGGPGLVATPAVVASAEVRRALADVIADSFNGYGNHYTANPLLDAELALLGYLDWADRTLCANPSDVVLLTEDDRTLGIATLEQDGRDLEILLAGVVSASQGRGLYGRLVTGVGQEALRRGCDRVIISTQAHNVRVQRAWVRAGFKPFAAVTTVHAVTAGLLVT